MSYWLAIGAADNWEIGLKKRVWGFAPRHGKTWDQINPGDTLSFYATAPVKGIIGYGAVRRTFQGRSQLWPQELEKKEILWPFRVEFNLQKALPKKDWADYRLNLDRRGIVFQRALQPLRETQARKLLKAFESAID